MKAPRGRVIVLVDKESQEDIYSKKVKNELGESVRIVFAISKNAADSGSEGDFARTAKVVSVGDGVSGVLPGDIAILDYLVYNDLSLLVMDNEDGKYFSVSCVTKYHDEDIVLPPAKRGVNPFFLARKGEIDSVSQVIGFIRGEKISAVDPYVLISFEPEEVDKMLPSGIQYKAKLGTMVHEVISLGQRSMDEYGIIPGAKVVIKPADAFVIDLPISPWKICAVNDSDVLAEEISFVSVSCQD